MEAWLRLLLPLEFPSLEAWTEYVGAFASTLEPDQLDAFDRDLLPKVRLLGGELVRRQERIASDLFADMCQRLAEDATPLELLAIEARRQDALRASDSIRPLMHTTTPSHARNPRAACAPLAPSTEPVLPEEIATLLVEREREDAVRDVLRATRVRLDVPDAAVRSTVLSLIDVGLCGALPSAIGCLKHLTRLDLNRNELESLPDSLGQLTMLEVLNVDRNLLTALPDAIGRLVQLRELRLDFNRIEALPETIGNLLELRILTGSKNALQRFPRSLVRLVNLRRLQFPLNPVEEGERTWFRQTLLPSLSRLESTIGTV